MLLLIAIGEYGHKLSGVGRNPGGGVDRAEVGGSVESDLDILGADAGAQQKNR